MVQNIKLKPKGFEYDIDSNKAYNFLNGAIRSFSKVVLDKLITDGIDDNLIELVTNKFLPIYKDVLNNLIEQEDKFCNLLIKLGMDKESLKVHSLEKINIKKVIDTENVTTLVNTYTEAVAEFIEILIYALRDRVIYLITEFNERSPVEKYAIEGLHLNNANHSIN